MNKLERSIYQLSLIEQMADHPGPIHRLDARCKLLVLCMYLLCLLSVPTDHWMQLSGFLLFPFITSKQAHLSYGKLFLYSLAVLPFLVLIGIFNTWSSFIGILIRGLASVQALFLLIRTTGFHVLCKGMQRMGVPILLVVQLWFVYRYLFVWLQEALSMDRARRARSYGNRAYPLSQWGIFVGQLLIRTLNRSEHLHRAMVARGFNGQFPLPYSFLWGTKDTCYLLCWSLFFLCLRFMPSILNQL